MCTKLYTINSPCAPHLSPPFLPILPLRAVKEKDTFLPWLSSSPAEGWKRSFKANAVALFRSRHSVRYRTFLCSSLQFGLKEIGVLNTRITAHQGGREQENRSQRSTRRNVRIRVLPLELEFRGKLEGETYSSIAPGRVSSPLTFL